VTARAIVARPLTAEAFAPFGDVIEAAGAPDFRINGGMCDRFHDRARMEFAGDGRAGISVGFGRPYALPLALTMVERHPLGSQAFVPMTADPFLVVVAPDRNGTPLAPLAFLTDGAQGVNYLRNVWHGVLTPLGQAAPFLIVDRVGSGDNLEEFHFDKPWSVATDGHVEKDTVD
jgi:ureidoglycolate lyase